MKLSEKILDLVYPRKCCFCHEKMGRAEGLICESCRGSIPYTGKDWKQKVPFTEWCAAPLFYEENVRESLHRFKFGGLNMYAGPYAEIICERIEIPGDIHFVSWVPLSRARLRSRGYDQAKLIADGISRIKGIPERRFLKKIINVKPQSRTGNFESRADNIRGAYRALDAEILKNKNILLVDDIVTTGSTLSECAAVLKTAGSGKIYAVCAARRRD